eukprot:CAMPEP_0172058762 /NCGR_PEP_ID=MMETSP1043-20130122/7033_1 /TAXON_ID=464988 /ORGANISM="Hemiselmis andersenii, Strain CCMP441" /LENGTH=1874 /DNA_ID=CAMNT_0012718341 /DNA_START=132 /DNA_END=5752 /DNA_ORIENTATION=-
MDWAQGLIEAILSEPSTRAFQKEDEKQRQGRHRVERFLGRVVHGEAKPTRIIDFAYGDKDHLGLQGEEKLLERCYCFQDTVAGVKRGGGGEPVADDDGWSVAAKKGKPKAKDCAERVILHVHTLVKWGDRATVEQRLHRPLSRITSVNVRHAQKKSESTWIQEGRGFHVVPKTMLPGGWQSFYPDRCSEIEWELQGENVVPPCDKNNADDYVKVRAAIVQAEASLKEQADRLISEGIKQTEKSFRSCGGQDVEYEVLLEEEEEEEEKESEVGIEFLVIGNDDYNLTGKDGARITLYNCVKDAEKVKEALEDIGARGLLVPNIVNKDRLQEEVDEWAEKRLHHNVRLAFIFWAGHALVGKDNLTRLVPTLSDGKSIPTTKLRLDRTVMLKELIAEVRKHNSTCWIVLCLDSCRTEEDLVDGAAFGCGLNEKGPEEMYRVLIVYSTSHGSKADDNSPFAASLLRCLREDELLRGSIIGFWTEVVKRTMDIQQGHSKQEPQIGGNIWRANADDLTMLPKKDSSTEALEASATVSSSTVGNHKFKFFSYIIVQPDIVLTWHVEHLKKHFALLKGMEGQLNSRGHLGWLQEHHPILLTDEKALSDAVLDLNYRGMSHSLVLCARGRGWVPVKKQPEGGELGPLLAAFSNKGWPEIIVVCQKYGAFRTAKILETASNKVVTVVWFRMDIELVDGEKFCSFIRSVLGKCANRYKDTEIELAESANILDLPKSDAGASQSIDDMGILPVGQHRASSWAAAGIAGANAILVETRGRLVHESESYGLKLKLNEKQELKAQVSIGDIDTFNELIRCIESIEEACVIYLEGCAKRTRLLAFQACTYFECQCTFKRVVRLRTEEDCSWLRKSGTEKTLLWVDFQYQNQDCFKNLWEAVDNADISAVLLLTHGDDDKATRETAEERVNDGLGFKITVPDREYVRASKLHEDVKFVNGSGCNLGDLARSISEILPYAASRFLPTPAMEESLDSDARWDPIAGIFEDDDGAIFARLCIRDVGYLQGLLDMVRTGKLDDVIAEKLKARSRGWSDAGARAAETIQVDRTYFVEKYEEMLYQLEELTQHQEEKLKEYEEQGLPNLHIRAPAGAGKTFVGLHLMLKQLEGSSGKILFVASNEGMAVFVAKWMYTRLKSRNPISVLERLHICFVGSSGPCICAVKAENSLLKTSPTDAVESYDMILVDEAHHIYISDAGADIRALREHVAALTSKKPPKRLVLLSDVSQSDGQDRPYPKEGMHEMRLEEVIRSTKRIVAGASAFQITESREGEAPILPRCNVPDGSHLPTFIFDQKERRGGSTLFELYATKVVDAMSNKVAGLFPGLSLHNRLAIIVRDESFRGGLQSALKLELEDRAKSEGPLQGRRFELVRARKACACLETGSVQDGAEWIVYDTVDAMDGLEKLIVIAVGLDEKGSASSPRALEVRSRIYRAMTRAQMMVCIVNEAVEGGWLEWLRSLKLDPSARDQVMEEAEKMVGTADRALIRTQVVDDQFSDGSNSVSDDESNSDSDAESDQVMRQDAKRRKVQDSEPQERDSKKRKEQNFEPRERDGKKRKAQDSEPRGEGNGGQLLNVPTTLTQDVTGEEHVSKDEGDLSIPVPIVEHDLGEVPTVQSFRMSCVYDTDGNDCQQSSTLSRQAFDPFNQSFSFVLSGDLVRGKDLDIDKRLVRFLVPGLIAKKDARVFEYLTSIEYVAVKAATRSVHALLRELADAHVLASQPSLQRDIECIRRFAGKHMDLLRKPPTPFTVFQLALQEPDDTVLFKAASAYRQRFDPMEWLHKPEEQGPCVMRQKFGSSVNSVAFSPDGKLMACGVGSKIVITDRVTGKVKCSLTGHKGRVWSVAFSPDSKTLASASDDETVKLWDLSGETPVEKGT